jgi:hypothetical protein
MPYTFDNSFIIPMLVATIDMLEKTRCCNPHHKRYNQLARRPFVQVPSTRPINQGQHFLFFLLSLFENGKEDVDYFLYL